MCVVAVARETRLTEEQIEKMWRANSHGGGVAWREKRGDTMIVRWEKGLGLEDMKSLIPKLPLPYVAHFRIASSGDVCDELTHPFPLDDDCSLEQSGETPNGVLFHNGTLTNWKDYLLDVSLRGHLKVPGGKWNDTRTMAWIAGQLGNGICEIFKQKIVCFGPTDEQTDFYGDWQTIATGLYVTNLGWNSSYSHNGHYYMGGHRGTTQNVYSDRNPQQTAGNTSSGGSANGTTTSAAAVTPLTGVSEVAPDDNPFRQGSEGTRAGGDQQERTETPAEGVGSTVPGSCAAAGPLNLVDAGELKDWALSRQSETPYKGSRRLVDPRMEVLPGPEEELGSVDAGGYGTCTALAVREGRTSRLPIGFAPHDFRLRERDCEVRQDRHDESDLSGEDSRELERRRADAAKGIVRQGNF